MKWRWIVSVGLVVIAPRAWAQVSACQSESDAQSKNCDTVVQTAVAQEQQNAIDAKAAAASSGNGMDKLGSVTQASTSAQTENIQSTKDYCEKVKKKCEDTCDQAAANARAKPNGQAEAKQIDQIKKKSCTDAIVTKENLLTANQKPLPGNGDQANQTNQASSGMPMPSMPSSGSGDSDQTPTQTAAATPTATTSDAQAAATPSAGPAGAGGLLAAKKSGTGSSTTSTDSSYKTASVGPSGVSSATGSGGGSGSGVGGAGMTTGSSGGLQPASATGVSSAGTREGASTGIGSLAVDGGGGGGGSGSSGGSENSLSGVDPSEVARLAKRFGPQSASAGAVKTVSGSTEVVEQFSQGLFKISDEAIGTYCSKKYLQKNCAK